ncbi:MAG: hypothetical protein INF47_02690, partial [Roseomonas sp.]|nr:hypothetical protein [Roseomonas sp.]
GALTEKNLARMVDFKFLSEIVCFIDLGSLTTTSARMLDNLYTKYDKDFPAAEITKAKIDYAMGILKGWQWLHGLNVVKPHILQMIIMSLINGRDTKVLQPEGAIKEGLSDLSEAIEIGQSIKWGEFISAASKTTNDKARKEVIYSSVSKVLFG